MSNIKSIRVLWSCPNGHLLTPSKTYLDRTDPTVERCNECGRVATEVEYQVSYSEFADGIPCFVVDLFYGKNSSIVFFKEEMTFGRVFRYELQVLLKSTGEYMNSTARKRFIEEGGMPDFNPTKNSNIDIVFYQSGIPNDIEATNLMAKFTEEVLAESERVGVKGIAGVYAMTVACPAENCGLMAPRLMGAYYQILLARHIHEQHYDEWESNQFRFAGLPNVVTEFLLQKGRLDRDTVMSKEEIDFMERWGDHIEALRDAQGMPF